MTKVLYEIDSALKSQLKNVPSLSGIYMMMDKKGEVIYIGKALNLKDRVRSYFNIASWKDRPKLCFMMPKVKEIKTVVTRSEKEALILEASLVNKHQPKYNVTLKDDKKFPWLMITHDESYPRVVPIRDVAGFKHKYPNTKNKFFGPYSDSGAMWETYKVLKEGFQLRLRRKPLFKDRPCMNYHLRLCSGPCQSLIIYDDYQKIVKQVEDFLLGKYDVVLEDLKKQMKEASKNLQYEKAAKFRDTIGKIKKVLEKQIVVSDEVSLSQDIFACDWSGQNMLLELLMVREGKVVAVESLPVDLPKDTELEIAFNEAIKQYYTRINDENIPKEIIVQFKLAEINYIEEWLTSRSKKKVTVICPKKGKKLELIKMAEHNAKLALQRVLLSNINNVGAIRELPLQELQKELGLKNIPNRIECFDISHLGGTGTVGSMVCFINGKPDKNEYRKFKLKTVLNKIDDFQSMKEIISRRYRMHSVIASEAKQSQDRSKSNEIASSPLQAPRNDVVLPDLIIIDGGKGQLSAAKEALESLNIDLNKIDLISLAKRLEEVFKPGEKKSILLDRKSKTLFLLQRIRDEAHRFAITFQRDTRTKDTFQSELEKISGLTKAKIQRLMNYFGSLKNIQEADLETFAKVLRQNKDVVGNILEKIKNL
ncbi:MAG: excinuclease ABC subunit UvrC [Candidatus Melainabacteria bacterium]|nr:excinuclease ABC subunit UvrC [Candidatus Melainabacteria bacterium]